MVGRVLDSRRKSLSAWSTRWDAGETTFWGTNSRRVGYEEEASVPFETSPTSDLKLREDKESVRLAFGTY